MLHLCVNNTQCMKIHKSIRLEENVIKYVEEQSTIHKRSFTNMIEVIIEFYKDNNIIK